MTDTRSIIYLDIETDEDELVAYGFAVGDSAVSVHMGNDPGPLRRLLEDPGYTVVTHTKYDVRFLRLAGWDVQATLHDTQVMAWILNENQFLDLATLTKKYLGVEMDKRIKRVSGTPLFRLDDGSMVRVRDVPWDQMERYNRDDVDQLRELYKSLRHRLEAKMWDDYWLEEEVPFTQVLLDMECAGMPVDLERSEKLRVRIEAEAAEREARLRADANLPDSFNLGSRDQLAAYLYKKRALLLDRLRLDEWEMGALKSCLAGEHDDCECDDGSHRKQGHPDMHVRDLLPAGFTIDRVGREYVEGHWNLRGLGFTVFEFTKLCEKGECGHGPGEQHTPSTATPTLMVHYAENEWVRDLIAWRKLTKLLTTYLRRFPEIARDSRLYGRFNQTGTKTGRLSSSEPNLQNQPARGELGEQMRALFRGDLIVADYSQLEPRLMAHFSQDPVLLDVYRTGKDVYLVTARGLFGRDVEKDEVERDISKTVFLGTQYGAGAKKLAAILALNGFPTPVDRAKEYLNALRRQYRTLFAWKDAVMAHVKQTGYVQTIGGRHRRLRHAFKDRKNYKAVGYGERQAVNAIIQGSAGDIVRRLMVRWPHYVEAGIHDALRLLAQVHDELVFEWLWPDAPGDARADALAGLQVAGEDGHGYDLDVPLVFEPHFGPSWGEAKAGTDSIELPDDDEEEGA